MRFGYKVSFSLFDKGVIETFGPVGVVNQTSVLSKIISNIQSGYIYHYTMAFGLSVILLGMVIGVIAFTGVNITSLIFVSCYIIGLSLIG